MRRESQVQGPKSKVQSLDDSEQSEDPRLDPQRRMARQAELVADWNATYKVGTYVQLTMDDGSKKDCFTRSEAHLLGGHSAVIWLEGVSSCYALDRCLVLPDQPRRKEAA